MARGAEQARGVVSNEQLRERQDWVGLYSIRNRRQQRCGRQFEALGTKVDERALESEPDGRQSGFYLVTHLGNKISTFIRFEWRWHLELVELVERSCNVFDAFRREVW